MTRISISVLAVALLVAGLASPNAQAQEAARSVAIPAHVEEILEQQGFVDVEVVFTQPQAVFATLEARMDGVHTSMANFLAASDKTPIDLRAAYDTIPLAIVRVNSADELAELAQNPFVVELGKTTMVASSARMAFQPAQFSTTTAITGAYNHHLTGNRGQGLTVAVLDSGADTDHVDLASSIVYERCYLRTAPTLCPNGSDRQAGTGSAEDDFGHGTAVSGLISSDGIVSPLGAAPEASLEIYKVLGSNGVGSFDEILAALDHISSSRPDIDVVNISASSGVRFPGACNVVTGAPVVAQTRTVIQDLQARGVVVVAAAGNQGDSAGMGFPACVSEVVSTAASRGTPSLASFSNVSAVTDVATPGESILAAAVGGGTQVLSGTSFATPLVSACLGLFKADGLTAISALRARLADSPLSIGGTGFSVPWLNCFPRCDNRVPDRVVAWGLDGTPGSDVIVGTLGDDIIEGNGGNDRICGSSGRDVIRGGASSDRIFGEGGPDVIWGSGGNDFLIGGDGPDRISGGTGRDTLRGGPGQDRLDGGAGSDFIYGEDQSDRLYGGSGNDLIDGAAGKDRLYGQGGDDQLLGGVNTDYLDGGAGYDTADGGPGNDRPLIVDVSGCRRVEQRVSC